MPVLLELLKECSTEGVVYACKALVTLSGYDDAVMFLGEYMKDERFRGTYKLLMTFSVQDNSPAL